MRHSLDAIETLAFDLLAGHGVAEAQARSVARIMAWCEGIGRPNFGLLRLPIHLKRLAAGVLAPDPALTFTRLAPAAGALDGGNGFGYFAAERAMDHAIALAREAGVGAVTVKASNFFGAGAWFVKQAADQGLIGLALSNSFPKVAAFGGIAPVLGTNPFAFGAPGPEGRHLLFDMATSALAGSTVREHMAKGAPLPEGLAIDAAGRAITDPARVEEGALLPMAGAKGFGLALLVEILAGVLAGAGTGAGVASMYKDMARPGSNGHMMIALDIAKWLPPDAFAGRFESLIALVKASGADVLYPGEARWRALENAKTNGVALSPETRAAIAPLCAAKGIAFG